MRVGKYSNDPAFLWETLAGVRETFRRWAKKELAVQRPVYEPLRAYSPVRVTCLRCGYTDRCECAKYARHERYGGVLRSVRPRGDS